VPSIGSISQKVDRLSKFLFDEVSSETIRISGVNLLILSINKLFTSRSPFVTGVLSSLMVSLRPFFLNDKDNLLAVWKVPIKSSTIFFFIF